MNKYTKSFAENLKDLIGETTISEFAEKVKIPQPTISRYLSCQRQVTFDNLVVLADYFDISIDVLIGRKDY